MLKAVLVDDEKMARENLATFLGRMYGKIEVVGDAGNIESAYDTINELKPDVIFLDIEMPGGNGFELLKKFSNIDFEIIFVTAYDHFAIKAIRFSALGYVMKPINAKELGHVVDRVIERIAFKTARKRESEFMHDLIDNLSTNNKARKLFIPDMNGFSVVETESILYCKADGNYTEIFTKNGKMVCSKTLKEIQDALSPNFYRISQSFIVNVNFVVKYKKGAGGTVIMSDKFEIDVPRRGKDDFLNFMNGHLQNG